MGSLVEPPLAQPSLELLATLVEPLFQRRVVLGGPGTAEPRERLLGVLADRQETVAIERDMCFHRHRGASAGGGGWYLPPIRSLTAFQPNSADPEADSAATIMIKE